MEGGPPSALLIPGSSLHWTGFHDKSIYHVEKETKKYSHPWLLEERNCVFSSELTLIYVPYVAGNICIYVLMFLMYSENICGRQAGGKKGTTGLQAHLSGRHILKGNMAVGQFTSGDSHTVDIRLGIITLKILSQKKKATDDFICSPGLCLEKEGLNKNWRKTMSVPQSEPAANDSLPVLLKINCYFTRNKRLVLLCSMLEGALGPWSCSA